jgi:hypothetical protein
MKTIQLTSPDSSQVQVSAMGPKKTERYAWNLAPLPIFKNRWILTFLPIRLKELTKRYKKGAVNGVNGKKV